MYLCTEDQSITEFPYEDSNFCGIKKEAILASNLVPYDNLKVVYTNIFLWQTTPTLIMIPYANVNIK